MTTVIVLEMVDVVVDLAMVSVWWSSKQHLMKMCAFYVTFLFFVAVF